MDLSNFERLLEAGQKLHLEGEKLHNFVHQAMEREDRRREREEARRREREEMEEMRRREEMEETRRREEIEEARRRDQIEWEREKEERERARAHELEMRTAGSALSTVCQLINRGLQYYDKDKPTGVLTDWSKTGIGFVVLQQRC